MESEGRTCATESAISTFLELVDNYSRRVEIESRLTASRGFLDHENAVLTKELSYLKKEWGMKEKRFRSELCSARSAAYTAEVVDETKLFDEERVSSVFDKLICRRERGSIHKGPRHSKKILSLKFHGDSYQYFLHNTDSKGYQFYYRKDGSGDFKRLPRVSQNQALINAMRISITTKIRQEIATQEKKERLREVRHLKSVRRRESVRKFTDSLREASSDFISR